ncbi:MAG: hypothetical protein CL678_09675 [Bdellovibrionaceae bacterium]|nr:hypothetical protein [Pseudobdellovibrionaceae bacterium]|tara:strand:+ start:181 stop:663 length:483 start_codon:yes stop_codon:yes gene_type:complete
MINNLWEQIINKHQSNLILFATGFLKNKEEAKEVVQEVYLECLKSPIPPSKSYLYQSVKNRALNSIRNSNRFHNFIEHFKFHTELYLNSSKNQKPNIKDWIYTLPTKQKEVLILRIRSELTIEEISEILSIPKGTVKSRLNSAISLLKKKMEKENENNSI